MRDRRRRERAFDIARRRETERRSRGAVSLDAAGWVIIGKIPSAAPSRSSKARKDLANRTARDVCHSAQAECAIILLPD
jgi:hypothetical protein